MTITAATTAWEDVIFRAVGYRVMRIRRTQFEFNSAEFQKRTQDVDMPNTKELVLHRVDTDFINSNRDFTRYIEPFWNSTDSYIRHGIGWVAMEGEEIRGLCDSAFVGGTLVELNIKVAKELRGRGIGYSLAVQFIRTCLEKGLTPNWTCDTQNVASFQMAQKLGFTPVRGYFNYTTRVPSHEPART